MYSISFARITSYPYSKFDNVFFLFHCQRFYYAPFPSLLGWQPRLPCSTAVDSEVKRPAFVTLLLKAGTFRPGSAEIWLLLCPWNITKKHNRRKRPIPESPMGSRFLSPLQQN